MPLSSLRDQCAALVLDLNNRLADTRNGSLIQVWLPEVSGNSRTVLSTHGLPYAVAGVGDLLALFRCISCRFSFSTDVMQPCSLGAIGRVYTTSEPEICGDVQKYDKKIYLRVSEAQRCRVHSTVVVPFFEPSTRHRTLGVIEVVRNDRGASFHELLDRVIASLESVHLCTSNVDFNQLEEGLKQWPADVDLHSFDLGLDLLQGGSDDHQIAAIRTGSENGGAMVSKTQVLPMMNYCNNQDPELLDVTHGCLGVDAFGVSTALQFPPMHHQLESSFSPFPTLDHPNPPAGVLEGQTNRSHFNLGFNRVSDLLDKSVGNPGPLFGSLGTGQEAEGSFQVEDGDQVLDKSKLEELLHVFSGNRYRRRKRRKMGRGKHLTYDDLQKHFHLGLKDAAGKLGICSTTLKRACRRNGIKRWPNKHTTKSTFNDNLNPRKPLEVRSTHNQNNSSTLKSLHHC